MELLLLSAALFVFVHRGLLEDEDGRGVLFLLAAWALYLLGWMAWFLYRRNQEIPRRRILAEQGLVAQGTLTKDAIRVLTKLSPARGFTGRTFSYEYRAHDGKAYRGKAYCGSWSFSVVLKKGDPVEVLYDPETPSLSLLALECEPR